MTIDRSRRKEGAGRWLRRMAVVLALVVSGAHGTAVAVAAEPPAFALDKEQRAEVARIEAYLNGIDTLRARFLQVSSEGSYSEGDFLLARPGRLRIEYDPPVPVLIVTNRSLLTYYDKELQQVSQMGVDSSPAGILVAEKISLLSGKALKVVGFERGSGTLRVTVIRPSEPHEGNVTLVFADSPLSLRKWIVTDAQGVVTTVSLVKTQFGVPIEPEQFEFHEPTPRRSDN